MSNKYLTVAENKRSLQCILVQIFNPGAIVSQHLYVQSQQSKQEKMVRNLVNVTYKVVLVSLLLTLNRYHTLFWCFHCWL